MPDPKIIPSKEDILVPDSACSCEKAQEDSSRDGGYGWVCVGAMFFLTAHTWGINGAFGVYLAYYLRSNQFPGATQLDFTFIGGLSNSQITFIAPVVTIFSRFYGTRTTLLTGAVLQAAALVASSFATQTWHLYLTQGVLLGWGSGFQYVGATGIVSQWFTRRRSLANGLAAGGSGLGGLVWSLATGSMIETMGLQWSFRITAICAFVVNVTCAMLMKNKPGLVKANQRAFDYDLLKRYEFVLILAWAFVSMLAYTIFLFSLPNFTTDLGFSLGQASIVGAMANLGMAVGRPVIGYYSDKVGVTNIATAATGFSSLVCFFIWMFAKSYAVLILTALLGGSVVGTFFAVIPSLLTSVLGLQELPSALSIVWTSIVFPCLFAEPIALKLKSSSNEKLSPKSVQIFAGSMFLLGTVILLLLRYCQVMTLASKLQEDVRPTLFDSEEGRKSSYYKEISRITERMFARGKF